MLLAHKMSEDDFQWVLVNYERAEYENEKCVLIGATDITEMKRFEHELVQASTTDPLTGIMNRRSGMNLLQNRLLHAQEDDDEFTLCFVDVNNLKLVNDKYGHPKGDAWIYTISSLIQKHLNMGDVFFRYGGDEFIILFNSTDMHCVNETWERIDKAFEAYNRQEKIPLAISVSKGFFTYHSGMSVSLQEIIDLADKEMYKDKTRVKK